MKVITNQAAAVLYAEKGWAVMPLQPKRKEPHFNLVKNAYLGATTDQALINFWFEVDPNANIGISCIASGLVVFDVDFRNGGNESKIKFPETYTVKTGDGFHYYYTVSQDVRFSGKLDDGIDIKHRGYVAAAPSMHPSGAIYTVVNDIEAAPISQDLLERATR